MLTFKTDFKKNWCCFCWRGIWDYGKRTICPYLLITAASKDLTLKTACHWVINLILHIAPLCILVDSHTTSQSMAGSFDQRSFLVVESTTCCLQSCWFSLSEHVLPEQSRSSHWTTPSCVGIVELQPGCSGMTLPLCGDTGLRGRHTFPVYHSFEGQCAPRCLGSRTASIRCGGGAHTTCLRGHWDGGPFGGSYPSECPLAPVFSLWVQGRGFVGRTGLQTSTRTVIRWPRRWQVATNIEETSHFDKQEDTSHLNDDSPVTCFSSLPPDTSFDSQHWQQTALTVFSEPRLSITWPYRPSPLDS